MKWSSRESGETVSNLFWTLVEQSNERTKSRSLESSYGSRLKKTVSHEWKAWESGLATVYHYEWSLLLYKWRGWCPTFGVILNTTSLTKRSERGTDRLEEHRNKEPSYIRSKRVFYLIVHKIRPVREWKRVFCRSSLSKDKMWSDFCFNQFKLKWLRKWKENGAWLGCCAYWWLYDYSWLMLMIFIVIIGQL